MKNGKQEGWHDHNTTSRVLTKIVRDIIREDSYETLADLTDELKVRCAKYHIRWSGDAITNAYRVVSSNTSLVKVSK